MEEEDLNPQRGESFIREYYYRIIDSPQRSEISYLYKPESIILWNGNRLRTGGNLQDFLRTVPASQHNVYSVDCQPTAAAPGAILVTVSGFVSYGVSEARKLFHQTFVLCPDSTQPTESNYWFIASDTFRLLQGEA